jgi:carnitine-CoA ligase
MTRLLRGTGAEPGPYVSAYPMVERTMLHVLRDRAAERPEGTWMVFDGRDRLTFGGARRAAHRIGHAVLADAGEAPHVALLLRNQPEFVLAFYGTLAASGVVVPMNADARGPLLQDVIERSGARLLVVRHDLLDVVARLGGLGDVRRVVVAGDGPLPDTLHGVPVTGFDEWSRDRPEAEPAPLPTFADTALIAFTSGTTGRQKGAVIPHHFLYLYSAAVSDSLGRTADDVLSTPLPLYHAAALNIITNSALHAGCVGHLKSRFSASRFWDEIAEDGATFAIIFGPMAAMISKSCEQAPPHRVDKVFCVPPPPDRRAFEEQFGVDIVFQGYGMTEVYPLPMRRENIPEAPGDTVGYPATWFDYGVVDEHDNLVDPGVVGELVWRCRWPYGMTTGYYKDEAATAEAFRNFAFHTGDLAVYDADGLVHYRGRRRDRIRHRGENVSATDVEFVALKHPDVLEAAVYGVPSEIGEEDIKLDVVLRSEADLGALHDWLSDNLPRFAVPRYVEVRKAFPKTPSERIEKWKLADLPLDRPEVTDFGDRRTRRPGS